MDYCRSCDHTHLVGTPCWFSPMRDLVAERDALKARAEAAEARVKELEQLLAADARDRPTNDAASIRLRTASESVGWLNSEGPLSVSPNRKRDV